MSKKEYSAHHIHRVRELMEAWSSDDLYGFMHQLAGMRAITAAIEVGAITARDLETVEAKSEVQLLARMVHDLTACVELLAGDIVGVGLELPE